MAAIEGLYPPNPTGVPAELTAPTAAYKRHAWLALATVLAFVLLYLGLTGYLGWLSYRGIRDAFSGGSFLSAVFAVPPLLFCAFLVRGLFVVTHRSDPSLIEVGETDEPALFAFVRRIADETGAPRPHRVYLSARVNAAVFYDLSIWNLLLPTRKNLEIGLGAVNALSLDEVKAVVAHEFGHFAQRTMTVGRYVYIAQQVVGHIVVSRGWFDRLLVVLSRIDLRIAWIGWIMRLLVWSIRAVLDTFFRAIVLAHRALTREMELQADLVAVSVSGSDSIVHALHRLGVADDAWDKAARFATGEAMGKRPPADLFAVQSRVLEHLRVVLDQAELGVPPPRPDGAAAHRVFKAEIAQPPRMWSTHPPNLEREQNAKQRYVPSALDGRPAWVLFQDPPRVRATVTRAFLDAALGPTLAGVTSPPIEETLAKLDADYSRPMLDRRYRGAYLGRSVVAAAARAFELVDNAALAADRSAVLAELDALYPEELSTELERQRELTSEKVLLSALKDGVLTAPGGVIRHRGDEIPRKRLGEVIDAVMRELGEADARVLAHDRACRTAHRAAARLVGRGWEPYLESLLALLHYADHAAADIRDAADHLHHVFRIVIADGRVSDAERRRLLLAALDVYAPLSAAYRDRDKIVLPEPVQEALEAESFAALLSEEFRFPPPVEGNLPEWLQAMDSWTDAASGALGLLASATLSALLSAEDHVARALREESDPGDAPPPAVAPGSYATLVLGKERERQKKLDWWDRFQLADGWLPGTARFAVAAGMLVPALLLGGSTGNTSVSIYNGLAVPVRVSIGDDVTNVPPRASGTLEPSPTARAEVVAETLDGRTIERFEADVENAWADHVYNVAGAAALVEWTAVYGSATERPERPLGAPRFFMTDADVLFREPPTSVSSRTGSSTLTVISGVADAPVDTQLELCPREDERRAMIAAHVRWDPLEDPQLVSWVGAAGAHPDLLPPIAGERVAAGENRVFWSRVEQDTGDEAAHSAVCERHRREAAAAPDDADLAFLAARCIQDPIERGAVVLAAHARHLDHPWLSMAAGYDAARRAQWAEAARLLSGSRGPTLAPIWPGVALDVARIRRILAGDPGIADLDDLADGSPPLSFLLNAERGELPYDEPEIAAFERGVRLLAEGRLAEAVAAADELPGSPMGRTLLRQAAASEGAERALIDRALSLAADDGITAMTIWPTIALVVREGRDATPFADRSRVMYEEDAAVLLELLDAGGLAADPTVMDRVTSRLTSPALRGQALVMGIVLLGEAAPETWRREARALLFAPERPYFR